MVTAASAAASATSSATSFTHDKTNTVLPKPIVTNINAGQSNIVSQSQNISAISNPNTTLDQRKICNNELNNTFTNILRCSNELINQKLKNPNDNSSTTTNFKIEDLTNFLMLENGTLNELAKDNNNHHLLVDLFQARIANAVNDLNNNTQIGASKAKKLIDNLSNAFIAFKGDHRNSGKLIAVMDEYDQQTNNIGLNVKITALLMRALGCQDAEHINIDLINIEKKDKDNDLLQKLDTLYKNQTDKIHDESIIKNINSTDFPVISSTQKQDVLKLFIAEKPNMVAELLVNYASQYVIKYANIEKILNHKCNHQVTTLANKAQNLQKNPDAITNFFKSLPSNQKAYIEKKLMSDIANIYASIVQNNLQINIPENKIINQSELFISCSNAISLLKNSDAVANAKLIDKLTTSQTSIKANMIENFIKMQLQLKLPDDKETSKETSKDDKKELTNRMLLLSNLSNQNIITYLNSTSANNKDLQVLFNNIIKYVNAMLAYGKEDKVDTRIAVHQTRFDLLKSQQEYIEKEATKFNNNKNYQSIPLNTNDFNNCLQKVATAYDLRKSKHATFRAIKSIRVFSDLPSAVLIPSIEYETKKEDLIGKLLNTRIKKTINYSFFQKIKTILKSIFSIFGKKEVKSKIRQKIDTERAKDPNITGSEAYNLKEGWKVNKLLSTTRAVLHYELKYMLELSKQNPYLFKKIAKNLATSIPLLVTICKGDVIIAELIKDINKKIGDEKFVNEQVDKKNQLPKFNNDFFTDPALAEAMRSLYFIEDLTSFADTYILTSLSIITLYLPEKTLTDFVDATFKNMLKKSGVNFVTDVVFYIMACIKQNRAVDFVPGENILKRVDLKWITVCINAFNRISTAITNTIAGKPNSVKKMFYEIYRMLRVLVITAFFAAITVLPMFLLLELSIIVALLITLAISVPIIHVVAEFEYGATSNQLSLASLFKNHYLSNMVVKDNYDNPDVKKCFKSEHDMLVNYNDTSNCIKEEPIPEPSVEVDANQISNTNTEETVVNNVATDNQAKNQTENQLIENSILNPA